MSYTFFVSLIVCAAVPPAVAIAIVERPRSFSDLCARPDVAVAIAFSVDAIRRLAIIASGTPMIYPGPILAFLTFVTLSGMALSFWARIAQIAKNRNQGVIPND